MLPRYVIQGPGGSVIAAVFLAHDYVSEQFGSYVEYGKGNFTGKVAKIVSQGPNIRLHFL